MRGLSRLLLVLLVIAVAIGAVTLAYMNPERVPVDVGLMRFEQVPLSVALVIAFAAGWVVGLVSVSFAMMRARRERRRLKRELHVAEAELRGLRSLQAADAD